MTVVINQSSSSPHQFTQLWRAAATLFKPFTGLRGDPTFKTAGRRHSHTQRLRAHLAGHIRQPGPEHYDFDPRKRRYR